MDLFYEVRWSPYLVGVGIGVLSWFTFLISHKALGCSTAFSQMGGMIEQLFGGKKIADKPYYKKIGLNIGWQGMLVIGIVIGSFVSAQLSGDFHFVLVPSRWAAAFGHTPVLRILVALIGGIFIGFGSRWADGCTSGHGISGTMQLAVSSWVSAIFFFIGGIIMAHLIF